VDTDPPITIPTPGPVESTCTLARLLEEAFGPEVTLIGKAVTFISMMTGEFILLLNEGGSTYVCRTQKMLGRMVEDGIGLDLYPILRLHYHTWDALEAISTSFHLPDHLALAFGKEEIEAPEFAARWHQVSQEQQHLLETLKTLTSPRELMTFLCQRDSALWQERLEEYIAAHDRVLEIHHQAEAMETEISRLRALEDELKAEVADLELQKGNHYREHIKPLRQRLWELSQEGITEGEEVDRLRQGIAAQEGPRAEFDRQIAAKRKEIQKTHRLWEETRKAYQKLDKSPETIEAEKHLARLEAEAEMSRAQLVRAAILTTQGLAHTNHRPTAWWLLMLDPSLTCFRRVAETTDLYLEPVARRTSEGC